MGIIFAFPYVMAIVLGGIGGPLALIFYAISGIAEFAMLIGLLTLSLICFFMSAVVWFGTAVVDGPFEIDVETGTTTDGQGRQWVRERHGPAKVHSNRFGPGAIIFPAFDMTDREAVGLAVPRTAGRMRRFLQRSFARITLGARGTEIDGLILPVGFLSDREAIMAAIKPVPPPFRWW
jgi:hypothetical protein